MFIILLKFSYSNSASSHPFFNWFKKKLQPQDTLEVPSITKDLSISLNPQPLQKTPTLTTFKSEFISTEPTIFKDQKIKESKEPQVEQIQETDATEMENLTKEERVQDFWNLKIKHSPLFQYMLAKESHKKKSEMPKGPLMLESLIRGERWENSEKIEQEEKERKDKERKEQEEKARVYQKLIKEEEKRRKKEIQKFYENQQNLLREIAIKEKEERDRKWKDNYSNLKKSLQKLPATTDLTNSKESTLDLID